jgi:hypothetical protein
MRDKRPRASDVESHPLGAPAAKTPRVDEDPEPWDRIQSGDFQVVRVKWSGDRCAVCSSEVDYDTDQLLHCHGCGIAVHQSCYGVRKLPRPEDKWICSACEAVHQGQPRPQCVVCPIDGGALKPTTLSGIWCHVACMHVRHHIRCKPAQHFARLHHCRQLSRDDQIEGVGGEGILAWQVICNLGA